MPCRDLRGVCGRRGAWVSVTLSSRATQLGHLPVCPGMGEEEAATTGGLSPVKEPWDFLSFQKTQPMKGLAPWESG